MINPVGRGGIPYSENRSEGRKQRRREIRDDGGVKVSIGSLSPEKEEVLNEKKVEHIKKLIKEGTYPLDRQKLAEKIVNFLLDGG